MQWNNDLLTKISAVVVVVGITTYFCALNFSLIFRQEKELCFSLCEVPNIKSLNISVV